MGLAALLRNLCPSRKALGSMGLATSGQRDFGQRDKGEIRRLSSNPIRLKNQLRGLSTIRVAPTQTYSAGL